MEGRKKSVWGDVRALWSQFFPISKPPVTTTPDLPDETWLKIFSFFKSQGELLPVKLTCKRFLDVASDPHLVIWEDITAMTVSPTHDLVAVAMHTREIVVQKLKGGLVARLRNNLMDDYNPIYTKLIFTKDNRYLIASRGTDISFEIWDLATQTLKYDKNKFDFDLIDADIEAHAFGFANLTALSNARLFIFITLPRENAKCYILDIPSGEMQEKILGQWEDPHGMETLSISEDERCLSLYQNHQLVVYDFETGEQVKSIPVSREFYEGKLQYIKASSTDKLFLCSKSATQFILFVYNKKSETAEEITIPRHDRDDFAWGRDFILSKDGRLIACFSKTGNDESSKWRRDKGMIEVFDIHTRTRIYQEACTLGSYQLKAPVFFLENNKLLIAHHNDIRITSLPNLTLKDEANIENEKISFRQ